MKKMLVCFLAAVALQLVPCSHSRAAQSDESPAPQLSNAGFESGLKDWEPHVYGAPAKIDIDDHFSHGGKSALVISTSAPSDAALGQEITLQPKQWYRFAGWVRTRALDPGRSGTFGTFQIQLPGGTGMLAAGVNHRGDTEWTETPIVFRAPDDGRVRVSIFFVGFGKGTGAAWFDDLKIEPIDLASLPVRITREPLNAGRISPYQYGQFIEYLCNLVPSMWAEKLYDGGFEGLSPYKVEFIKQTDFKEKPWYPSGQTNRARFALDATNPVGGKVSQEIDAAGDTPCEVGISQDGIAISAEVPCHFSCYLRQEGVAGPVNVELHDESKVLASATFQPSDKWKKFAAVLKPSESVISATFTIRFRGPGKVWIDNASLMPDDAVGGWRRDVVEALRDLRPGVIRFGGSALDSPGYGDFEWRDTIGDPDHRKTLRAWGGLQPAGAGLEEIVQLCQRVGAEPLICVRTRECKAKDAADEVLYFNGAADTPMGHLRAANGHSEPYRIKFWQIGNERGDPTYLAQLRPFATAMRRADPNIRLLGSYPSQAVLREAGDLLDYICPHQYNCADLVGSDAELGRTAALIGAAHLNHPVRIGVTEWNTTGGDFGPARAKLWTLENALAVARYHNLLHRRCDLVEIANRSNLTNSFCSGIIQTDNHRLFKTPAYYAQQLYATLAGYRPLKIESSVPADSAPDMSATISQDGKRVTLFAINETSGPITRPLDLSAFETGAHDLDVWTLSDRERAGEPDAANSFADPQRVSSIRSNRHVDAATFQYSFPAFSLTVLQWPAAE